MKRLLMILCLLTCPVYAQTVPGTNLPTKLKAPPDTTATIIWVIPGEGFNYPQYSNTSLKPQPKHVLFTKDGRVYQYEYTTESPYSPSSSTY